MADVPNTPGRHGSTEPSRQQAAQGVEETAALNALLARSERELKTTLQDDAVEGLDAETARVFVDSPRRRPQSSAQHSLASSRWSAIKHALLSGTRFGVPNTRHLPPAPPPPSQRPPRHLPPAPPPGKKAAPSTESAQPQEETQEPPAQEIRKTVRGGVSPIHTFQQDIERVVRTGKLRVTAIAALEAERQAREKSADTSTPPRKKHWRPRDIALAALSALFVLGGAGLLGWAFLFRPAPVPITEGPDRALPQFFKPDIILTYQLPPQANRTIVLQDLEKTRQASELALGSVAAVYPVKSEQQSQRPVSAAEFLSLLRAHIPESLQLVLEQPFMFGFHGYRDKPSYVVLRVRSFEEGVRGMLSWEPYLLADFSPLFGAPLAQERENAQFKDSLVRNNDVRILRDAQGQERVVYGFADRALLVITTNSTTYYEILSRLRRTQQIAP
ncbi:MAG: hypothetical protein KatS3mg099_226 [Candidatus Parcubacteria bacterium]|nr:MAG: hypothetical protein KatS3mg099_226 [Candidatus Parcubacteria bacterium]